MPVTTKTADNSVLYRGFGGKGGRYIGKHWGSALHLTFDFEIACLYGWQDRVLRANVANWHELNVIDAASTDAKRLSLAADPSILAMELGIDGVINQDSHWHNSVHPHEVILFGDPRVTFEPLTSKEQALYDQLQPIIAGSA